MDKRKKKLLTVAFVLLNLAVIAYTAISEFGGGSKGTVAPQFCAGSIGYLLGAVCCLAVLFAAESTKYVLMMRTLGEKISWRAGFETAAIGKYYDNITPSGAGGQPFQIYWLHKRGYSDGAASAMTIVGFIMMQFGFIVLALIALLFRQSDEAEALRITAWVGLLAYSLVPGLLIASYYSPGAVTKLVTAAIHFGAKLHFVKDPERASATVEEKVGAFHDSYQTLARKRGILLLLLLLSVLFQISLCSLPYFVLRALGGDLDYFHILAVTVLIYAAVTIIPTPGNAGAAEGTFYLVFSAMDSAGVFWAMLIWRLFCYYAFLAIGGGVYLVSDLEAKYHERKELFHGRN